MTTPTIGDMIAHHQLLKAYVEQEKVKFSEAIKPYTNAIETIEATVQAELTRQGLKNFKSDDGTAYLSTTLSVKVDNRDKFLQFVTQGHWEFLDARALKAPVQEWIEQNPAAAPSEIGLITQPVITCNIRKSS